MAGINSIYTEEGDVLTQPLQPVTPDNAYEQSALSSRVNRRNFLRGSAMAATGLALQAAYSPSEARAQDESGEDIVFPEVSISRQTFYPEGVDPEDAAPLDANILEIEWPFQHELGAFTAVEMRMLKFFKGTQEEVPLSGWPHKKFGGDKESMNDINYEQMFVQRDGEPTKLKILLHAFSAPQYNFRHEQAAALEQSYTDFYKETGYEELATISALTYGVPMGLIEVYTTEYDYAVEVALHFEKEGVERIIKRSGRLDGKIKKNEESILSSTRVINRIELVEASLGVDNAYSEHKGQELPKDPAAPIEPPILPEIPKIPDDPIFKPDGYYTT